MEHKVTLQNQDQCLEIAPPLLGSETCLFGGCSVAGEGSIEAGQTIFHIVDKYSFKKDGSEKRLMQLMHFFWALGTYNGPRSLFVILS